MATKGTSQAQGTVVTELCLAPDDSWDSTRGAPRKQRKGRREVHGRKHSQGQMEEPMESLAPPVPPRGPELVPQCIGELQRYSSNGHNSHTSLNGYAGHPHVADLSHQHTNGRGKSYSSMNGFGFIESQDTFQRFGRDVFLHKEHNLGMPQARDMQPPTYQPPPNPGCHQVAAPPSCYATRIS